jgi:thiol-disulfide isomerase/thioredoxin
MEQLTPLPAPNINWDDANNIMLNTMEGTQVSLSSIWQGKKTVIIFMRSFDCATCYTYAILFSHLQPVLKRADIRTVFVSCSSDLSEIHVFIKGFAFWLRKISMDGMHPMPGELYFNPSREAYKFFGIGTYLSKTGSIAVLGSAKFGKFLGMFKKEKSKTFKESGISETEAYLTMTDYLTSNRPEDSKPVDLSSDSILWQSPGIVVIENNELLYRVRFYL